MVKYWTAYDTIYNARPGEMESSGHFGMVKPISHYNNGEDTIESFFLRIKELANNCFENANQSLVIDIYRPDWVKWIGKPKNIIMNIRFKENNGETHNPFMIEADEKINA